MTVEVIEGEGKFRVIDSFPLDGQEPDWEALQQAKYPDEQKALQ